MVRMTWTPQQGRHNAFIQGQLHPETLLLGSSVLRALPVQKEIATSHPTSASRESSPLHLVHSNVSSPMPHQSLGGVLYFVSFIDESTRKVWAYLIRNKDRVFENWLAMVENQFCRKLKCLRTDNEGQKSSEFVKFCRDAAFDMNIRHPVIRSKMELPNA